MTSTNSNIWKRFLFNNQHTIYNKDIIEYHIQYNNNIDSSDDKDTNLENDTEDIEKIIINHMDTIMIYILIGLFCFRKYF